MVDSSLESLFCVRAHPQWPGNGNDSASFLQEVPPVRQFLSQLHDRHAASDGLHDRLGIAAASLLIALRAGDPVHPEINLCAVEGCPIADVKAAAGPTTALRSAAAVHRQGHADTRLCILASSNASAQPSRAAT